MRIPIDQVLSEVDRAEDIARSILGSDYVLDRDILIRRCGYVGALWRLAGNFICEIGGDLGLLNEIGEKVHGRGMISLRLFEKGRKSGNGKRKTYDI